MRLNNILIVSALSLLAIVLIILAIWLPSNTRFADIDFHIFDKNNNFLLEQGEELEFIINDSIAFKDSEMLWEFGNGDSKANLNKVKYTYKNAGNYLVTLKIDNYTEVAKYIEIIGVTQNRAIDSVPKIHGADRAYVNEKIVFLTTTPGIKSWNWEFGESGTIDAYERQVVYSYKSPGTYQVKLKTDQSSFPVYHKIQILPLFNPITTEPIDSLQIVANDIKNRFQAIANARVTNTKAYFENLRHIENNYMCSGNDMVIIINDDKYNDLYSYSQGLHYLDGRGSSSIVINEVTVDTIRCITRINVSQNTIKQ